MSKHGLKINTSHDLYRWYLNKKLKENPGWYLVSDQGIRQRGICHLYKSDGKVHMTYTWFKAILEKNNTKAKEAIIAGERYNLGRNLGFLLARRVERDFSKPACNVVATVKYRKENPLQKNVVVYFTDEDYCRIAWHKPPMRNGSVYEFTPSKEFRISFSHTLKHTPRLKFKYLYFPLISKS